MEIAVLGLGLIGGSLLQALAAVGHRVAGYDADPAARAAAVDPAGRWRVAASTAAAVAGTDLVVLAVPLPAVADVLGNLGRTGYPGLVTDVTSAKGPVAELIAAHPGGRRIRFVGGHPMAGRELSGYRAADPALFADCAWVLCLEPAGTDLSDWLELARVITALGARVVPATAVEHDRAVAAISHVPHLLASALAATAITDPLAATLGAGSFRDGTRVAASHPALTAAMCGGNAAAVVSALDSVRATLDAARTALVGADPIPALHGWLATGHQARTGWPTRPGPGVDIPATAASLLALGRAGGWVTGVADETTTVAAVRPADPQPLVG